MSDAGPKARLGRIFKDKGSRRLLSIAGIAIVGALGYAVLGGGSEAVSPSQLRGAPAAKSVQGGSAVNPAYEAALGSADEQRITAARREGGSAMRTMVGARAEERLPERLDLDGPPEPPPEPPPVVRRPTPPPRPQPQPVAVPRPSAPSAVQAGPARPVANPDHVAAIRQQMSTLMGPDRPIPARIQYFHSGDLPAVAETAPQLVATPTSLPGQDTDAPRLPLAGTVLYANMVSEANSDAPGPVLATVLQGDFAGSTLIGSFQTRESALVISFDRMTVRKMADGRKIDRTIPIQAVAVDVEKVGTALATDVDRHLFQKVGISFAAGFIDGLGGAIAQAGTTTTQRTDGSVTSSTPELNTNEKLAVAAGTAASTTGQILMQEFGTRPTTVVVRSGTPIGVLFLQTESAR